MQAALGCFVALLLAMTISAYNCHTSPGRKARKSFSRNSGASQGFRQREGRRIDGFVGQLERTVMMREREFAPQSMKACTASAGFMCWSRMNQRGS